MIIFDEKKYAENIIKNGYKNKKYISYDNIILVKYWKSLGLQEKEIRDKLQHIMSDFQELFNDKFLEHKVNKAIKVGMKFDLLTNVTVNITQTELDQVRSLEALELQKMMFILLVAWKHKGCPQRLRITNTDIMSLAKVKASSNIFWEYIHQLVKCKMIKMVEYKNRSYYKINMASDKNSEVVLHIDNFDDVINYYLSLVQPELYKSCGSCGVPFYPTNNSQKYCKICAREKQKEWEKYSKRKNRKKWQVTESP